MVTRITLPEVRVGGYRRALRSANDEAVAERFLRHCENVERLKGELSEEIQRRDLAQAEFNARIARRTPGLCGQMIHEVGHVA